MTLQYRPRRIRSSDILRDLTAETILDRNKLIMPHFITEGKGIRENQRTPAAEYQYKCCDGY